MSPAEIAWRLQSAMRDVTDRYRFALGLIPSPSISVAESPLRLSDMPLGAWLSPQASKDEISWCEQLVQEADDIVRHRLSFFDLKRHAMGDPIDWNRDHACNKPAPMIFAQAIDYRDFRVTGDCKLVWEPNRHHQLVVLGRAYRATGDVRYAQAVVEQMNSWLQQNPFGIGMNWRSPLELGIRLINWVWAIDLIRDSGLFNGEFRERVLQAVYLHCWENARKYSRGSSANNHLVGEAAGVFIASSYFHELPEAARWRAASRAILLREIHAQTYPDGCTREQALGYEFFVLQFYIFSGVIAGKAGEEFPREYWAKVEQMLEFLGALSEGGDKLPLFGDCDDGYVLNLGSSQHDTSALLCIGAVLFGRQDFRALAGAYREPAHWLLGGASRARFNAIPGGPSGLPLQSRAFSDSGYYLLQSGEANSRNRISVLFDCGELGLGSIAAHGHADALSFSLRAFGVDVLVDPGTYDYFTYPVWRNYLRSTRAHNCVVVDDADQSEMLGPFLWGTRANARCLRWEPQSQGGSVSGEHDGYTRLTDPVIHRRTLELDDASGTLTIRDEIDARGSHAIAVYFHLSEFCKVLSTQNNRCDIEVGGGRVALEMDTSLVLQSLTGSEAPIAGWVSRGYHHKTPATTIIGRTTSHGKITLVCRIKVAPPAKG
jgi:hypothetical protein